MPLFEFEETCTSRPLYQVQADTLEEAVEKYRGNHAYLRDEPVEENYLVAVRRDDELITEELKRQFPEIIPYA